MGIIIGAVAGGLLLILVLVGVVIYAKKRSETIKKQETPFVSWDPTSRSGSTPQIKGPKCFSFDELRKGTNNFSEANGIGYGGYGKVYRGILAEGQIVAIKRSQRGSMQGGLEFKTEIELLSRVHHKNP